MPTVPADRLRRIAELNHHIRNALQVIACDKVPERSERAIQVNKAVIRIELVLREVLPERKRDKIGISIRPRRLVPRRDFLLPQFSGYH
jgi:hypothetical protein